MDTDEDWSWREKGKCWGRHAPGASGARDPWFPAENTTSVVSTPHQLEREEAAARLCAGCPVIEQCLTYGVEHPGVVGVWGGTLTRQRRIERRKRSRSVRWRRENGLDTSQVPA